MADTGERDVRDRLAEATRRIRGLEGEWASLAPGMRESWRLKADELLAALPTVGLRIGRVEE